VLNTLAFIVVPSTTGVSALSISAIISVGV